MYKVTLRQKNSSDSYSYQDEMDFTFETMEAVTYFCEHAMSHGVNPVTVSISMAEEEDFTKLKAEGAGNDDV